MLWSDLTKVCPSEEGISPRGDVTFVVVSFHRDLHHQAQPRYIRHAVKWSTYCLCCCYLLVIKVQDHCKRDISLYKKTLSCRMDNKGESGLTRNRWQRLIKRQQKQKVDAIENAVKVEENTIPRLQAMWVIIWLGQILWRKTVVFHKIHYVTLMT